MGWPDEPFLNLRQTATPNGTPANGGALLYVKSDGKLYTKNSAGVEALVADNASLWLAKANNLSDLSNVATARTNLGLGNAATQSVSGSVVGTTDTQTLTNKTLGTGTKVGSATTDLSGSWATFTPTVTAGSGTFTTVSAALRYMQLGKTVHWNCVITITTVGTAAGVVNFTLPVAVSATPTIAHIGSGRENALTGKALQVYRGATTASVLNYDNTSAIAAGASLLLSGTYEAA